MTLHPFLANLVEQARHAGRPPLDEGTPEDARASMAQLKSVLGRGPEVARVSELGIPGDGGPIPARIYVPADARGIVIYVHGGGWVLGTLDEFDALARRIAVESGAAVVLPAYRLAPENPFPGGLSDVVSVLRHVASHAHEIDPAEAGIVVAGDSAGGNLAAVAVLEAREVAVRGQALIYPVCDGDLNTGSYREFGSGYPLTRRDMAWFYDLYLGAEQDRRLDARVSPMRRTDLAGAPPTLLITAECDVLRDECEAFGALLSAAGVPIAAHRIPGTTHGFFRFAELIEPARYAVRLVARFAQSRFVRDAETAR